MGDSSWQGMKEIFIAGGGHHTATVMGAISFPALAINSDASSTVHRAPVIQVVKQTVQLPRKSTHRRGNSAASDTRCGLVKV
jgi:hypothetical protein